MKKLSVVIELFSKEDTDAGSGVTHERCPCKKFRFLSLKLPYLFVSLMVGEHKCDDEG